MQKLLHIYLIALCFQLSSCNPASKSDSGIATDEFSKWKFPLLEPYEITCPEEDDETWMLVLERPDLTSPDYSLLGDLEFMDITLIGIKNSIIVLENKQYFWPALGALTPAVLIINTKNGESFLYSKGYHKKAIEEKYKELGIESVQMHEWLKIKADFQENSELPKDWNWKD